MINMSELRIKNRSERYLRSCEDQIKLQIKPRNNSEAPTGFEPMTSAIPVRCYEASPEAGQVRVQFIPVI